METIAINTLPIGKGSRVLDLGCGHGRHTHAVAWHFPTAFCLGIDINPADVAIAKTKANDFFTPLKRPNACQFSAADGQALPFSNASFDVVICSEVLEHIPQYQTLLTEIERILKPSGTLAISVPRAWPERICWRLSREYHQVEGGHVRIFNAKKLQQEVIDLGFTTDTRYFAHALHSPYWWLRCLFWRQGENAAVCRTYHKMLVWDLLKKPWLTQTLERLLNPFMGKSVVWHFTKNTFKDAACPPNLKR
jgi:ubiquinone/menaquinone biosynthesis C-methylase UbiE